MLVVKGERLREADAGLRAAVSSRTLAQSHYMVRDEKPMQTAAEAPSCRGTRIPGKLGRLNEAEGVADPVEDHN
jgi:hypothetical protein